MSVIKKPYVIGITMLVTGLLLGWLIFGPGPGSDSGQPNEQHAHAEQVQTWTCSMHPQIRQGEPGKCPICGMDLIPLEIDGDDGPMNALRMSPTAIQLAGIHTAVVGSVEPVKTIRLPGKVQADERMVITQSSHIPGRVEKLNVTFTGEYISKGQVIASIYSPNLVSAQKELFEAGKLRETQPVLYRAAREKLKNWKLTDEQIDQIEQAGSPVELFPVLADVSGYVIQKKVNRGDYIQKGQPLFEIADLSRVWVLFDVYESDMAWVKVGSKVNYSVSSLPGKSFTGNVSYFDPVINPKTRTAKARVEAINASLKLKPEMFVTGTIEADIRDENSALAIPKSAVLWTGKRSVVYVKSQTDNGIYFTMREIEKGPSLEDSYMVISGLEEGEEIAVQGAFSIDAAAQLAGKPSMMNPEGAQAGGNSEPNEKKHKNDLLQSIPSPVKISKAQANQLNIVIEKYLVLKNNLVNDDFNSTLSSIEGLNDAIAAMDKTTSNSADDYWGHASSDLLSGIKLMANISNIEEGRELFVSLSESIISTAKTFALADQQLFVQFCPMADSNRGAWWLSENREIMNPYFGSAMLRCGEIVDELSEM